MRDVACDVCGAAAAELFAERPDRADVLHARFVRCRRCGFVYASPRATASEAQAFYNSVEERGSGELMADVHGLAWRKAVDARRRHLDEAAEVLGVPGRRFLELGFGDASALVAAQELGWEPYGLEYAQWLVEAARRRHGLKHVSVGDIADACFKPEMFDVVYAWHVIEHVLDIDTWVREIVRVLRPGGVLVIGTESARSLYGTLWRASFRVRGRMPWPPTSTDHTYWFDVTSLRAVLERNGLSVRALRVYENSPREILSGQSAARLRNPRWLVALGFYLASSVAALVVPSTGGKLAAIAQRTTPES